MFDYPFHIGDYLSGTAHLTDAEDLTYRRMIDLYYQKEQPLSIDEAAVARRVRMPVDIVKAILDEFFTLSEDGWHNERCDRELDKYRKRVADARKAGKASAHKRSTTVQRPFNDRSTDGQRSGNQPTSLLPYSPTSQREEKEPKGSQKNVFQKPTLEQVREYCQERKNGVDPERFCDHYESNGWMVGKNKMKDWMAAVRTWEKNSPPPKPESDKDIDMSDGVRFDD